MNKLIAYLADHHVTAWHRGGRLYAIQIWCARRDGGPMAEIVEIEPTFKAVRIHLGY